MTNTAAVTAPSTELQKPNTERQRATGSDFQRQHQASGPHQRAAHQAVQANTTQLTVPLGGSELHLTLPPLDKMAFYGGLAGAVAFGVIEWPIAVITGVGHLLSDNRRDRTVRALGEALDAV